MSVSQAQGRIPQQQGGAGEAGAQGVSASASAQRTSPVETPAPGASPGAVVVGCDGSWWSESALAAAVEEARRRGSRLVVLAVGAPRPARTNRLEDVLRSVAEAKAAAAAVASHASARAHETAPDLVVQTVVAEDVDAREVHEVAVSAELLVLGRTGATGGVALTAGSTSADLARAMDCPLLVVHDRPIAAPVERGARAPRKPSVVVGLDARPGSQDLLDLAADEAAVRNARLIAVHAVAPGVVERGRELISAWARCRAVARRDAAPGRLAVRLVITRDAPEAALASRAEEGDLVVVGTRGEGRLAGLVGDSVSRAVLRSTRADVLVVPPGTVSRAGTHAGTGRVAAQGARPRTD